MIYPNHLTVQSCTTLFRVSNCCRFPLCSGGGSRGSDPFPDERSDEAAAAVQSQDPAACRAQQEELHPGGRAEEATAGQSGASGLPTE